MQHSESKTVEKAKSAEPSNQSQGFGAFGNEHSHSGTHSELQKSQTVVKMKTKGCLLAVGTQVEIEPCIQEEDEGNDNE